jgi:hypothetical protein
VTPRPCPLLTRRHPARRPRHGGQSRRGRDEKLVADTKRLAKEKLGGENGWRDLMADLPMGRAATTDEVSGMIAFWRRIIAPPSAAIRF